MAQTLKGVAAKRALQDLAIFRAIKQCAPLFEFPHTFRRFLCMELRHPPVIQKFPAAHGVAKMRAPIVGLVDIAHGRSDSTLGHNGVRFAEQ